MPIKVLDDTTINKIAAGEVVERPVSVVKELVENAIDSGASAVSIEIKGGGIDMIRVTDNGSGIEKDSIPTAFLRHATSKISSADDLTDIISLGFRGEALSSIAAVSQTEILTKTKNSILGYRYVIHGGKERSFDEAGVPDGTTIIVRNLFYNTPARKKFLKSAITEGGYINELIERLILSHPEISFKYVSNGSLKSSSDGKSDIASNIYTIFGRDAANKLIEVSSGSENMSVHAFVGKPELGRGNRNYELFFVNNRYIRSKVLSSAVEEAYKPYLMLHRFPFIILYIDIIPSLIDVNVHPAKTEIRFMDERAVFDTIVSLTTEGITKKELIPEADHDKEIQKPSEPVIIKPADVPEPFEDKRIPEYAEKITPQRQTIEETVRPVQETLFKEGFLGPVNRARHKIIGQVFDTYWIIEYEEKLYIVDQHAAHEKVLYERFSKQIQSGKVASQMISPPHIVTLTGSEEETLKENMNVFAETGFTIEHFGGCEYAISSVPTDLFGMGECEYFTAILDDLSEGVKHSSIEQVKNRIATMACKAAVKGNMRLSYREADALISELLSCDNPYNCPHGRPTVISYSKADLEKMFKRIV